LEIIYDFLKQPESPVCSLGMNTRDRLDNTAFRLKVIAAHVAESFPLEARELRRLADGLYGILDEEHFEKLLDCLYP
jgi:hypothetical protein